MRFLLETTEDLKRRLKITVPADDVDQQVKKRLQKIKGRVRIDGFRPGKIPFEIIMQSQHAVSMRLQVLDETMKNAYNNALKESNVKSVGDPNFEIAVNERGKDFEFVANFEIYPEMKLKDFSTIEIEKPEAQIEEKDVNKMIDALRKQQQKWVDAEDGAAAETGCRATINCNAVILGDTVKEGVFKDKFIVLGENQSFPDFDKNLIGVKAGETCVFNLDFSDNYHEDFKNFKGKNIEFTVTINKIQKSELPKLDQDFFKLFGIEEGGEEKFRKEVRDNMVRELKYITRRTVKNKVWENLLRIHPADLPEKLIQIEFMQLCKQYKERMNNAQNNTNQADDAQISVDSFKKNAEKRVHLGMIVSEIISFHNIELDNVRLSETLAEISASYQDSEAVIKWYLNNDELLSQVKHLVLEDQIIDFVLEKAQVKPKACSYEEVILST